MIWRAVADMLWSRWSPSRACESRPAAIAVLVRYTRENCPVEGRTEGWRMVRGDGKARMSAFISSCF